MQPTRRSPFGCSGPGTAFIFSIALATLVLAVYLPSIRNDFIDLDDSLYVYENDHVQTGLTWENVAWAFRSGEQSNWHPLTWLSHLLDVQLFGMRPAPHHLVNVGVHAANTLLLFLVLLRMTGAAWRCAFVAALFALHPLHVESVAWVAERKDVLSTFFGLLALGAYVSHAQQSEIPGPASDGDRPKADQPRLHSASQNSPFTFHVSLVYLLSLGFFALSLMSKPTLVTLPFLFLLLDFWPLQRLSFPPGRALFRLVAEKLPFFALTTASCVVTLVVQRRGGSVWPYEYMSLSPRLANAVLGYVAYLKKAFWPADLAVVYPLPDQLLPWQVAVAATLLVGLTFAAVLARRRRFWLVGWFWFLGMLVPMIGLVQVGDQAIADRYTYLPLVGLFLALTWGISELCPPRPWRRLGLGAGMLILLGCCAGLTSRQLAYWRNTETLMRHALAVTKDNFLAYGSLGTFFRKAGRINEALENYRASVAISPSWRTLSGLGLILAGQGNLTGAVAQCEAAVRLAPGNLQVRVNLSAVLSQSGKLDEAAAQCRFVLLKRPDDVQALNNLGIVLTKQGRLAEAIGQFQRVLRLNPNFAGAYVNLGNALVGQNQIPQAIEQFRQFVRLQPNDIRGRQRLGGVLFDQGRLDEALPEFRAALRLQPDNPENHFFLGLTCQRLGKTDEARLHYQEALRLRPDYPDARLLLDSLPSPPAKP